MKYMSAGEAADLWGISQRRVQILCATERIEGAFKVGTAWIIPCNAKKPLDKRVKNKKLGESV